MNARYAVTVTAVAALATLAAACSGPAGAGSADPSTPAAHAGTGGDGAGPNRGYGVVSKTQPGCTLRIQGAPRLPAGDVAMIKVPARPFGVSVTSDGRWGYVSMADKIGVFRLGGRAPGLVRAIPGNFDALGNVLTDGGKYLLAADAGGSGAVVLSASTAERTSRRAVVGELGGPMSSRLSGSIEVAVTPDGRFAFVSLEEADEIAVFRLARALTSGFNRADYVGAIPAQLAPVGLAVSPDGRWLYSTSEVERPPSMVGSLSVISVAEAEKDPARSVVARVAAGCNPVRVITSANGRVVWVTARASDALLAFSASRLRSRRSAALLASVRVGELPVGLALVRDGSLIVVADSDLFVVPGQHASLAVVDVADAFAGRAALVGYLPAGPFPRDIAAAGGSLLVADFGSGQVESVDLAKLP